jgi:hypothetical protein
MTALPGAGTAGLSIALNELGGQGHPTHHRVLRAQGDGEMREIFAQGDLLLERVTDVAPSGAIQENLAGMAMVLAEGEESGHRHAIAEPVTLFRDDKLAKDIPADLYIGHLKVTSDYARVTHDEHAPITLPRGTYRVRRQRELGPQDARVLAD